MSLPVILRPEAAQDLQGAKEWYEQQRTGLGLNFANRVGAALDRIGLFPELYGMVWQDVRAAPVRRHPYVIYFRVLEQCVEVLAVLHAHMESSTWQSRV
jgi:plasmid stabilization system protein ParE